MGKSSVAAMALLILFFAGCSSKSSILVPGKSESDCESVVGALGVCGTPENILKYEDRLKKVYYQEGSSYAINNQGKIKDVETGEEITPGVRPDACGNAFCPGCGENDASADGGRGASKNVRLQNRSLLLQTNQSATVIRDLGYQRTMWVAPYTSKRGDLVEAHRIHVEIREPKWVIGEPYPEKTKSAVVVPTPIAKQLLTDDRTTVDRGVERRIEQFIRTEKYGRYPNIDRLIQMDKKEEDAR